MRLRTCWGEAGALNPASMTQKILTNRKLNKKGGNVGFEYLKNDVSRVAATAGKTLNMSRRCPPRRAVLFLFNQTKGKRLSV